MQNAETGTHQVGKRVELLADHARLIPPPGDLAIEEIEEEAREWEGERRPQIVLVVCDKIFGGHEHRERAAYAVSNCD